MLRVLEWLLEPFTPRRTWTSRAIVVGMLLVIAVMFLLAWFVPEFRLYSGGE